MNDIAVIQGAEWTQMIEETFSKVSGHYLDRGTSLAETLSGLSAERVSRPAPGNGETAAGHVFHALFYLRVVEDSVTGVRTEKADWTRSWVVKTVDARGWADLLDQLTRAEARLRSAAFTWDGSDPERFGGLLTMVVHTAFHLGAIRQILDATADRSEPV